MPHFLDGRVRVEVETALPAFVAARLAVTGEEAEAGPLVPAPAANSSLALVAEVGCMNLSDVKDFRDGGPPAGCQQQRAAQADHAIDVVVNPMMFNVVPGWPVSVVTLRQKIVQNQDLQKHW